MDQIELYISGLEQSVTNVNSYAVVLQEQQGNRRLVIVIGVFEARAIAIGLEDMKTYRPFTHDLIWRMFTTFDFKLESVFINELREGIFHSVLHCRDRKSGIEYFLDSRTSDALALAARLKSPIYTTPTIMDEVGMSDREEIEEDELVEQPKPMVKQLSDFSIPELEEMMQDLIEKENYEEAARVRDIIKQKQT